MRKTQDMLSSSYIIPTPLHCNRMKPPPPKPEPDDMYILIHMKEPTRLGSMHYGRHYHKTGIKVPPSR